MGSTEKNELLERLTKTHSGIASILEGVDLEQRVYSDPDWRIRDILGHIATWDQEVTRSLRAFLAGTEYGIPNLDEDESDFNEQAVTEQRKLTTQQLVAEWKQARKDYIEAVSAIPPDKFPGDLLYPWGDERGSIALLVEYMLEHDEEHKAEIVEVLKASAGD